jgi:hypothetical protein
MSDFIKVMDNFHIKKGTIAKKKTHEIEHLLKCIFNYIN